MRISVDSQDVMLVATEFLFVFWKCRFATLILPEYRKDKLYIIRSRNVFQKPSIWGMMTLPNHVGNKICCYISPIIWKIYNNNNNKRCIVYVNLLGSLLVLINLLLKTMQWERQHYYLHSAEGKTEDWEVVLLPLCYLLFT